VSRKIYIDTCIYLNYFQKESNLQSIAEKLFFETLECKFEIIVSDHIISELMRYVSPPNFKMLFRLLRNKIINIKCTKDDQTKARESELHEEDALHIAIAKNNKAECIVTRDKEMLSNRWLKSCKPEELIRR
jgi:predicted nucleic acid-binding protein